MNKHSETLLTKNNDADMVREPVREGLAKTGRDQQRESLAKAKEMLKNLGKENKVPVDVFPPEIQDFILTYYNFYKYPLDYYFASVLTCAGVAIGNAYTAEYQPEWEGVGMLWTILVGGSSIGKSQVMKPCLKPLRKIQNRFIDNYDEELDRWKILNEGKQPKEQTPKPSPKRMVTSKSTNEKLIELLQKNQKGILMSRSEIQGWLKSMNQYNKGDDQENYMEWWDNDDWSDDKKSTGFVYLQRPFLAILGGIQTKIVQKMGSGDNAATGFFQRLLFAMPTDETIPMPKQGFPDASTYAMYEKIIVKLYDLPNRFTEADKDNPDKETKVRSCAIPMSEKAKERFFQYRCESVTKRNDAEDDIIKSMLGKLETYVLRFAVIIELLKFVSENHKIGLISKVYDYGYEISEDTVIKAIRVADYFEQTGRQVTNRLESPVHSLPPMQKLWYESLPEFETFKAQTAINTAKKITEKHKVRGLGERTIKSLLRNKVLFKKVQSGGHYERLY